MCPASPPKSCTPIGRSTSSKSRYSRVRSCRRKIPSAETNSVVRTSAPCSLHSWRKILSETPAIGARKSGKPRNQGSCGGGEVERWSIEVLEYWSVGIALTSILSRGERKKPGVDGFSELIAHILSQDTASCR